MEPTQEQGTGLTPEQGKSLLQLARSTIGAHLQGQTPEKPTGYDPVFNKKRGVFVTLNTLDGNLRGCIGYPEPIKPLINAVMDSAINAAVHDPRFPAVTNDEIGNIEIELTVLTPPELIEVKSPAQYRHQIQIGRDGLIVERGVSKGLLLPQVADEYNWEEEEFLQQTCLKAGLPQDAWEDPATKVYKFQGQIFKE